MLTVVDLDTLEMAFQIPEKFSPRVFINQEVVLTLEPFPVFDDRCFDCFNCIRECPEAAITPAVSLEQIAAMIRERVETYDEQPPTQVFF